MVFLSVVFLIAGKIMIAWAMFGRPLVCSLLVFVIRAEPKLTLMTTAKHTSAGPGSLAGPFRPGLGAGVWGRGGRIGQWLGRGLGPGFDLVELLVKNTAIIQ